MKQSTDKAPQSNPHITHWKGRAMVVLYQAASEPVHSTEAGFFESATVGPFLCELEAKQAAKRMSEALPGCGPWSVTHSLHPAGAFDFAEAESKQEKARATLASLGAIH